MQLGLLNQIGKVIVKGERRIALMPVTWWEGGLKPSKVYVCRIQIEVDFWIYKKTIFIKSTNLAILDG